MILEVLVKFCQYGSQKAPNLEIEREDFIQLVRELELLPRGAVVRVELRADHHFFEGANLLLLDLDMVMNGVKVAGPVGWCTVRMFEKDRNEMITRFQEGKHS